MGYKYKISDKLTKGVPGTLYHRHLIWNRFDIYIFCSGNDTSQNQKNGEFDDPRAESNDIMISDEESELELNLYRESDQGGKAENDMDVDSKEGIDPPHNSVASTCESSDSSANSEDDNAVTVGPVTSNLRQTNLVDSSVSRYPLKWMRKYSERGCSTSDKME